MMKIKIYILSVFMAIVSWSCCNNNREQSTSVDVLELSDKSIEKEMIKYISFIKNRDSGKWKDADTIRFYINYCQINDSVERFVISAFINPEHFKNNPFYSLCKVGKDTCFFKFVKWDKVNRLVPQYIQPSKEKYEKLVERFFPVAHRSIKNRGYIYPQILYEPEICCITVKNGVIIESHMYRGLPDDVFHGIEDETGTIPNDLN
ncbi:MAG: hypothetical protein IJM78_04010 [Prevotella sp.]|nr:hypothetical protein [Prevotella sp.]